mgnify:CR=1 FL=1
MLYSGLTHPTRIEKKLPAKSQLRLQVYQLNYEFVWGVDAERLVVRHRGPFSKCDGAKRPPSPVGDAPRWRSLSAGLTAIAQFSLLYRRAYLFIFKSFLHHKSPLCCVSVICRWLLPLCRSITVPIQMQNSFLHRDRGTMKFV